MSFWDDLGKKAAQVAGQVSDKLGDFADTAGTEFGILKLKRAIGLLEAEIHEIEQKMGRRVYDLHRHEKIEDKELKTLCFEVDGLRKRISENEDEIERLRREAEDQREREARDRARQAEADRTGDELRREAAAEEKTVGPDDEGPTE